MDDLLCDDLEGSGPAALEVVDDEDDEIAMLAIEPLEDFTDRPALQIFGCDDEPSSPSSPARLRLVDDGIGCDEPSSLSSPARLRLVDDDGDGNDYKH